MGLTHNIFEGALDENGVIQIGIVAKNNRFNKFKDDYLSSRWDNKVISTANFLNLPVSTCLFDKNLSLIKGTNGEALGYNTVFEFITEGLGVVWEEWKSNVEALIFKVEFGINSDSANDVILQLEDVKNHLGRKPVSKFEFNLAKDGILAQQVSEMKSEHNEAISQMKSKITTLVKQIESERKDKFEAIESLDRALNDIKALKEDSTGELTSHIEASLYNRIVEELSELKEEHELLASHYLERIASLEVTSEEHVSVINELKNLIALRDEQLKNRNSLGLSIHQKDIKDLKLKVIDLLKQNIHKTKVIKKQKIVIKKQDEFSDALKTKNNELKIESGKIKVDRAALSKKLRIQATKEVKSKNNLLSPSVIFCSILSTATITALYFL